MPMAAPVSVSPAAAPTIEEKPKEEKKLEEEERREEEALEGLAALFG
jgi:ribosomal protein L12E/L44/L45/RPP1/RPP2